MTASGPQIAHGLGMSVAGSDRSRDQGRTPEKVASANDNGHLHADAHERVDLHRHAIQHLRINTELMLSNQGLSAELEKHTVVACRRGTLSGHGC